MEQIDKVEFIAKIKLMLNVVDGTHAPASAVIGAYAFALKQFSIQEITEAIDTLIADMDCHITPAHIRNQIQGEPKKKLSESEMRSAAAIELAKPHWERMGFKTEEAYEKYNHELWLKKQNAASE